MPVPTFHPHEHTPLTLTLAPATHSELQAWFDVHDWEMAAELSACGGQSFTITHGQWVEACESLYISATEFGGPWARTAERLAYKIEKAGYGHFENGLWNPEPRAREAV